jgi:transposase
MQLSTHLSEEEILFQFQAQKRYNQFVVWQIIYTAFKHPDKKCIEISEMLSQPQWKIYRTVERYNQEKILFDGLTERGGRRAATSFMSLDDEKKLFEDFTNKALNGLLLTYNDIKDEVEKRLGQTVSNDYIWDLFKRHNWTKKVPRPEHPLKDPLKGEEFKKNSKRTWQPPQKNL